MQCKNFNLALSNNPQFTLSTWLVGNSPNRDAPQEEHYLTEQLFHCILFIIAGTEEHVLL